VQHFEEGFIYFKPYKSHIAKYKMQKHFFFLEKRKPVLKEKLRECF